MLDLFTAQLLVLVPRTTRNVQRALCLSQKLEKEHRRVPRFFLQLRLDAILKLLTPEEQTVYDASLSARRESR